jgi:DNA primase
MFLPDGEDPDSLVRKEGKRTFIERVGEAAPAIEYLFAELSAGLDLRQLDDQARLASLVLPYIEKVPQGVLKQLMQNRLTQITGLAGTPKSPARARTAERPSSREGGLTPLTRRLLGYLLRVPESLTSVDPEIRRVVGGYASSDSFAEVVKYIDDNPGADRSELVGRWAGSPLAAEIGRLADQPHTLPEDAVARELQEGLESYVAGKIRETRRQLVSELKEAPSPEKLKALRTLQEAPLGHSGAGDGSKRD